MTDHGPTAEHPEAARPEVWSALFIGSELVRVLNATRSTPDGSPCPVFTTADGSRITRDIAGARIVIDHAGSRCDLTVLPERIAISYIGDYSPAALTALYVIDWLHEGGVLPTDPSQLSAAQIGMLSDLRSTPPAG